MELILEERSAEKKRNAKRARREGRIPVAVYSKGKETLLFSCDGTVFQKYLTKIAKGRLPTTIFELEINGKPQRALVKDIQYHVTTYAVLHLDFELLEPGQKINVRVPVECVGVADCVGIKSGGGMLRQVIRHFRVNAPSESIPESFVLDVRGLALNQALKLKDISLPEAVKPLLPLEQVAVSIVKR